MKKKTNKQKKSKDKCLPYLLTTKITSKSNKSTVYNSSA